MKQIILIFFIILCGCKDNNTQGKQYLKLSDTKIMHRQETQYLEIDAKNTKEIDTDDFLSIVKSVSYTALDSKELIGEVTKMIVTDQHIYIMDSFVAQQIFIFDRQGTLLFTIKDKGQGPEEYLSIWDMCIDTLKNEIILNDAIARSYIYYSSENGKFLRKENGIANCYLARINDKYVNLLGHGQDFNEDEDWSIIVYDDSVLYKGFSLEPIQKSDFMKNSFHYDSDNQLLYTPLNSDTIYQIASDSTYFPKYIISQKKSVWNRKNDFLSDSEVCDLIKSGGYTRYCGDFHSTNNHIIFNIDKEFNDFIASQCHIYDKNNNIVYKWNVTKPKEIVEIVGKPIAVFDDTFFTTISPSSELLKYKDTLNKELLDILLKSNDDSNPILISYKIL